MKPLKEQSIAVVYGGNSAEREVSLKSGAAVHNALKTLGFNAELIDTKAFCLSDLAKKGIDRVFIALHGRGGEDGCIQGGFGSSVIEFMADHGYHSKVVRLGIPDRFIEHGTQLELHRECGFDPDGIYRAAQKILEPAFV